MSFVTSSSFCLVSKMSFLSLSSRYARAEVEKPWLHSSMTRTATHYTFG